jgi:hypothetical protein
MPQKGGCVSPSTRRFETQRWKLEKQKVMFSLYHAIKHNPGARLGVDGQRHAPMTFTPETAPLEEARWATGLVWMDSGEGKIPYLPFRDRSTWWHSWLRHCAGSQKVGVSIANGGHWNYSLT